MSREVWLYGPEYNTAFRFYPETGQHHLVKFRERVPILAGSGRRCGRTFVALYVTETEDRELWLQVGQRRFLIDGQTNVSHLSRRGGMVSELVVVREGEESVAVRQRTLASAFLQKWDPSYDDLDRSMDDFLQDVADVIHSPGRQQQMFESTDPSASLIAD